MLKLIANAPKTTNMYSNITSSYLFGTQRAKVELNLEPT